MLRRTKIICTIGPAVLSYEKLCELVDAGMNVARLNFSHGDHEQHGKTIELLKKVRKEKNVPLAIMLDTKGPEVRLGKLPHGPIEFEAGESLTLTHKEDTKDVQITPKIAFDVLTVGGKLLIDDGYITAVIKEKTDDIAIIEFQNKGKLSDHKSVSIPHVDLDLPAMTAKDKEDIIFGCKAGVDIVAASFVCSPEHVVSMKRTLATQGCHDILVISKIESALGVKNFDAILQVSDGIMVARGDLGVELPLAQVPRLQKMMIKKTYEAFKPVVTATQMLESMGENPLPTRAEASDVANAIYDSTSAVMLSGETAVGKYPIQAVKIMKEIICETENAIDYADFFYSNMSRLAFHDISSSVSLATVKTAYSSTAKAIFACTSSGYTAKAISRFRPEMPILAITDNEKTYNQLALSWGVIPIRETVSELREAIDAVSCYALKNKIVAYGDLVVITAGSPFGVVGTTNTMLVDHIGDVLVRGKPHKGNVVHGKVHLFMPEEEGRKVPTKGQIAVLTFCSMEYKDALIDAEGLILQNSPDDFESEKYAATIANELKIPILTRADGAAVILHDGQVITLDVARGLVFKGYMENEEQILSRFCKT